MPRDRKAEKKFEIVVERGRISSLTIYEVTEEELLKLERGSPVALFLNMAIFCFSTATSFAISLLTTIIESDRTFTTFVVISTISYLATVTFFVLWYRDRHALHSVVEQIKSRLPPSGGVPAD